MSLTIEKIIKKKINKFFIFSQKNNTSFNLPKIKTLTITSNLGVELEKNENFRKHIKENFLNITLQNPKLILAKKSVSNFKLRKKDKLVFLCNLKKKKLFIFLTKLIFFILPHIENFKIKEKKLDLDFNLNLGLNEIFTFPEIGFSSNSKNFGFNLNFNIKKPKKLNNKKHFIKLLFSNYV